MPSRRPRLICTRRCSDRGQHCSRTSPMMPSTAWSVSASGFELFNVARYARHLSRGSLRSTRASGSGYGKATANLARICVERGYGRLEWWVLDEPNMQSSWRFYESQGARALREWVPHRVTGDALIALAGGTTSQNDLRKTPDQARHPTPFRSSLAWSSCKCCKAL